MIEIKELNNYSIKFRTNNKRLLADLKPLWNSQTKNGIGYWWAPTSDLLLKKILIYETNLEIQSYLNKKTKLNNELTSLVASNNHPELREYQKQGASQIKLGSHILIWQMQTGKTATVCNGLSDCKKAIVLVEKGHSDKWHNEFVRFGNRQDTYILLAENQTTQIEKVDKLNEFRNAETGILIMTSFLASKLINELGIYAFGNVDYLVIDEAHFLVNNKTKRSKALSKLKLKTDKTVLLTGTPTSKGAWQFIYLLKFVYGETTFPNYLLHPYFFNLIYNHFSSFKEPSTVKIEREAEWISFISNYSSNVLLDEKLKPQIIRKTYYLELNGYQKEIYDRLENEHAYGDFQIMDVMGLIVRQQQVLLTPELLGLPSKNEIKYLFLNWYLTNFPDEQIIIFCTFSQYLKLLFSRFKNKYQCGLLIGETSSINRNKAVKDFQNKKIKILFCNTIAGGKGWTLNKADAIIFLNRDWNPANNEQAEARMNAYIKEIKDKKIIDVVIKNTIETYLIEAINNKWSQTEIVNKYSQIKL